MCYMILYDFNMEFYMSFNVVFYMIFHVGIYMIMNVGMYMSTKEHSEIFECPIFPDNMVLL